MPGGVFISYRREDSRGSAGRIYDRLVRRLGRDAIFFDVDSKIPPGMDFFEILTERVSASHALVAIIGAGWSSSLDRDSRRRIDNPNDPVRIEIETALERGIRVIPVLVDGATMPRPEDLPDSLKKLARRQGIEVSDIRFDADVKQLTRHLAQLAEEIRKQIAAETAVAEEPQRQVAADAVPRTAKEPRAREDEERARQKAAEAARVEEARRQAEEADQAAEDRRAKEIAEAERAERARLEAAEAAGKAQKARVEAKKAQEAEEERERQAAAATAIETGNNYIRVGDYAQAMTSYRKAADQGDALAQNLIGYLYQEGQGVQQDYAQAMAWHRKAADQGDATAQNWVGMFYANGQGVRRDYAQAMAWLRKAADQGDTLAQFNVGLLYQNGWG